MDGMASGLEGMVEACRLDKKDGLGDLLPILLW